jgi:O-antigen/teichoic acid export membrane protein
MLSTLAKLGDAAVVGSFALGLAITAPVFMFTNLQLRGVQATDARNDFVFSDYFTLRLLTTVAGLVFVCGLALVGGYDPSTRAVILLVGLCKGIESLSDVVAGLLQKAERLDRVAISLMIRGVCSLFVFALTFHSTHSLPAAVMALLLAWIVVYVLYDLRQVRLFAAQESRLFALRRTRLQKLALLSAPLGVVMTLISLNVNIPRYLLEHALGPAELGIFASLAYLLVAVNLIVSAVGQSAVSRLSRLFADGDYRGFRRISGGMLGMAALLLCCGVPLARILGRSLLTLLYRPEYGRHNSLFVLMVATAGIAAIASFLGYGMTAARAFRLQVPVIAASTLTTAGCALALIPRFGADGAASALFVGACIQTLGSAAILHHALQKIRRVA